MRESVFERAYPLARRSAQVRARAAVAAGVIQPADREDVEQEAVFACWRAAAKFDPSRASVATFFEHVIARRIASVARGRRRLRANCSLEPASDHCADPAFHHRELRIDIERLLRACGGEEQRLARLLMEHTPTETGRILGVARSTVYERIQKLRPRFSAAGLGPRQMGPSISDLLVSPDPGTGKGGTQ
jgi:RNA polymerase sigma factor (sigma-70 family)